MKDIYLDYAAATPMDGAVKKVMEPFLSDDFYNPSATYLAAKKTRQKLEDARGKVAAVIGARQAEVIFTAGATEANNLAIQGMMNQYPEGEVIASSIEHESVIEPMKMFRHKIVPVNKEGLVDIAKLEKLVSGNTVLVSIGYVNNELGVAQPLPQITKLLNMLSKSSRVSKKIYLHSDAAQAACYFPLQVSRLGVDLMSLNGGKIYGPKQSGALYIKAGTSLKPLVVGGGQEFGLRSGTENVAASVGFAEALQLAQAKRKNEAERITALRQQFIASLPPQAHVNTAKNISPHIISVTFPGHDNERLMMQLDEAGIQAAIGSACSASSEEPSYVLSAIGLNKEEARSTLRFSFGRQTSKAEIISACSILNSIVSVKR